MTDEDFDEDMSEEDEEMPKSEFNIVTSILIFGFLSVIIVFFAALITASLNNYALSDLYNMVSSFASTGMIPPSFVATADLTVANYANILNYLDYVWLSAFIGFVISSLVLSYHKKREGFFSMFTYIIFGLIVVTYIGSMFLELTVWFKDEILFAVFPVLAAKMPFLTWYINNMGVVNLILLSLTILLNFVDLDMSRYSKRKDKELNFDEI